MRIASISLSLLLLAGVARAAPSLPDTLLAGRTAGEPVHCISQTRIIDTQTFDDGSIFYRMSEKNDYLQRPHDCPRLNSGRAFATETHSTQLCSGDTLNVFDAAAHIPYGACILDDFVPYSKKKRAQ